MAGQSSGIQSIHRAMQILMQFRPDKPVLTLSELTNALQISRASTHRHVVTLRNLGLLLYDDSTGEYRVGPRIVEMANSALAGLGIVELARPFLEDLVDKISETALLTVSDGRGLTVVDVVEPQGQLITVSVRVGTQLDFLNSAHGLAFLSTVPPDSRARYARDWEQKASELDEASRTGLAFSGGVVRGIRGIATPVWDGMQATACVGLIGTTASIPEGPDSEIGTQLKLVAARIHSRSTGSSNGTSTMAPQEPQTAKGGE